MTALSGNLLPLLLVVGVSVAIYVDLLSNPG
jgi:hypothetical protein